MIESWLMGSLLAINIIQWVVIFCLDKTLSKLATHWKDSIGDLCAHLENHGKLYYGLIERAIDHGKLVASTNAVETHANAK